MQLTEFLNVSSKSFFQEQLKWQISMLADTVYHSISFTHFAQGNFQTTSFYAASLIDQRMLLGCICG